MTADEGEMLAFAKLYDPQDIHVSQEEAAKGPFGAVIGLNRFGASAPQQDVYAKLGLTVDAVIGAAQTLLEA